MNAKIVNKPRAKSLTKEYTDMRREKRRGNMGGMAMGNKKKHMMKMRQPKGGGY